jgi:uncharacterized protein YciI
MSDARGEASGALQVSLGYFQAWTAKDFERAMTFVADDVVCDTPGGKLDGADAFRAFMEPFTAIVTRAELIASFGDERTALLMYDTDTVPVSRAPGAEFHRVDDGKITHVTIIFDRQPFTAARAVQPSSYYAVQFRTTYRSLDDAMGTDPGLISEHVAHSLDMHQRGDLVMAGAFLDESDSEELQTLAITSSSEAAETYVADDPFVREGKIVEHRIRHWSNIFATPPR